MILAIYYRVVKHANFICIALFVVIYLQQNKNTELVDCG